jgi:hypothetical protein
MAKSAKATAPSKAHNGNGRHAAAKGDQGLNVSLPSTLEEGLRNRTDQISRALFSTEGADMSASATLKAPKAAARKRETAESMASRQKEIAVSEFFAKNRHLLGFDNPRKALLTTVKEAVDNSLDACEEAGILPNVAVIIEDLQPDRPANAKQSRYRVTVVDNGPGIVR